MQKPLVVLAAAGQLARITFHLQDPNGLIGVRAIFDPYDVSDFAEADLSSLRLLASPKVCGYIDIACLDAEFAAGLTGVQWLPLPSVSLSFACSQINHNDSCDAFERSQEDSDVDDNGFEAWCESDDEINDFYD
jgi:hypothetical protein